MTKDLALLKGGDGGWLTTEDFIAALAAGLTARLTEVRAERP